MLLDAYKLDGTLLWRIDLGRNIREGAHYTQFMVYDLDGDGRAEVACKTADGTVDGAGQGRSATRRRTIARCSCRPTASRCGDQRRADGKVLAGPEFLTVFDGLTGAALATTDYIAGATRIDGWGGIGGNGGNDNNGNRVDRFLAGVAYLDGQRPSVVMARGYYGRTVLAAWDWRDGKLDLALGLRPGSRAPAYPWTRTRRRSRARAITTCRSPTSTATARTRSSTARWWSTTTARACSRPACGTATRCTSAISIPRGPGLEVFGIHENEGQTVALGTPGMALYDARTGEIIWSLLPGATSAAGWRPTSIRAIAGYEFWGATSRAGLLDGAGPADCRRADAR